MILTPVSMESASTLYELLKERTREGSISHAEVPSFEDHVAFVNTHPFRYWFLIEQDGPVGDLQVSRNNEIGIFLFRRFQGRGYGSDALQLFLKTHEPLPAIPAQRVARWLANINPDNHGSVRFFERMGFKTVQVTKAL